MADRGLTPGGEMHGQHEGIVERLAAEAIGLGADLLDIQYKDSYEEVFAAKGGVATASPGSEFEPQRRSRYARSCIALPGGSGVSRGRISV